MGLVATWGEGEHDEADLASTAGWADFGAWADTLDAGEYRQVVHLWEHGYSRDVAGLADQLAAAVGASAPDDPSVLGTAANLLSIARRARGADYLAVSDGIGRASGGDEVDDEAADFDPA